MPNPGAFQGSRREFLNGKKAEFARSVTFGYTADLLSTIQREYFKRYPVDLPHNEEPSAEHLAAVDDDAPDPEIEEPDEKEMDPEEFKVAMARIHERKVLVTKRRAQIKRWFIYQYMKDNDGDPRDQRATSPYYAYLAKIRGQDRDKPRRKSAVNLWRKFQRTRIDKLAKLAAERKGIPKSRMAALRDTIAREMFDALPRAEQSEWSNTAVEEHKEALEEWDRIRHGPVSTDPANRQMAIQNMVRFVQPVLDVIADSTGWKVSLFAGGPEPAQEGMLSVISVHSGTTMGDIKLSYGQAERASIKKDFIPSFGAFLRKCYSPDECRSRALPDIEGFVPVSDMEMEGGDAMVHSLDGSPSNTPTDPQPPVESAPAIIPPAVEATTPSKTPTANPASTMVHTLAVSSHSAQPVASPASSSIQPTVVQPSDIASKLNGSIEDNPEDLEDLEDEETPFPLSYRLPSESPAAVNCLLPSPSHSFHSLPPSPVVGPVTANGPVDDILPGSTDVMHTSPSLSVANKAESAPAARPLASLSPLSTSVGSLSASVVISPPAPAVVPPSAPAPAPAVVPPSAPAIVSPSVRVAITPSAPVASPDTSDPNGCSTEPHVQSAIGKESAKAPGDAEGHRPRREVKKTAKAISIEEETLRKGARGKKRACEGAEEAAVASPAKKVRAGSRKKALKG